MKTLFKLITSLLIFGLMLLSGCGTQSMSLPSELRAPNTDYPDTINIIAPDFFEYKYSDNADQIKQQWLDEMSQRYGVNFNIISDYYTDSENYDFSASNKARDVLWGDEKFEGLFSINSRNYQLGIRYDVLLPLEDYLADNPVWNALPDDFKSLFEADGHIYGIPTSVFHGQYARVIHDEALLKTGITVTDLDSFRDFVLSYTQKTSNPAIMALDILELKDIFNSFGLYPAEQGVPFCFDPTEDCYVDMMTKDTAVEALEYLRELYKAGAIGSGHSGDIEQFQSGMIATDYRQFLDFENCTEVVTLNPAYPQTAFTFTYGFAMTKDTPQPKETINFFVDMLFGSEQNYLECWLGSSENYMLNSDGTITFEMPKDAEGNFVYPCKPNLTGGLPDIFSHSDANIFFSQNGVVTMESKTEAGHHNAQFMMQYNLLKNGTVVEIPPPLQIIKSTTYDANKNFADRWYYECFETAITDFDMTVQQAVDDYLGAMLNIGGNAMLDEMNAAIGKKTTYYYG